MGLLYRVIESTANVYDAAMGVLFMFLVCGKSNKYKNKKAFWLYSVIYVFILAFLQDKPDSYVFQAIIIVAVLFVYARDMLSLQIAEQLMYSIIFIVSMATVSMMTNLFCVRILHISVPEIIAEGGLDRFIGIICNKLMFTAILCGVVILKQHVSFALRDSVIVLLFLAGVLCIGVSITQVWNSDETLALYSGQLLLFMLGFICMCAVAVACICRLRIQNRYKMENEVLKTKLNEERDMIDKIKEMYEDNQILRHDLKRYLTNVQGLLIDNDIQAASKYIENVIDAHFEAHLTVYSNSSVVNAVINDIKSRCDKSKIGMQVYIDGEIPEQLQCNLGIILSNLLENAYEAELLEQEDSRAISLRMQIQKGMYNIFIGNYINSSVLKANPDLLTKKGDKTNHGIGIKSVKKLVAELEGICNFSESDHMFISTISIPIPVNCA